MSSISAARIAGLLETYDFSRITKLIDVGGAHGAMAAAIAKRYAGIRCTCFDLPGAERGALKTFQDSGIADRAISSEVISSRMFLPAPTRISFRPSCTIGAMNNACRSSATAGAAFQIREDF
jgi:hypothetical protein